MVEAVCVVRLNRQNTDECFVQEAEDLGNRAGIDVTGTYFSRSSIGLSEADLHAVKRLMDDRGTRHLVVWSIDRLSRDPGMMPRLYEILGEDISIYLIDQTGWI